MNIPYIDLERQNKQVNAKINAAISKVVKKQSFVLGEELEEFETEFAEYLGSKYVCGVNSGTDGLTLALRALGVGKGDEVITPAQSFIASALAITEVGATPVFVDIDSDTYQIDATKIQEKITNRTKAILPVHLYGAPCEIDKILKIAEENNLKVVEDSCQAHGATLDNKKTGTFGEIGVFSFYPSKNLGAYGDGGAICTNDSALFNEVMSLRNYGQTKKYHHDHLGVNSRLDDLQACILRVKLKYLDEWNRKRNQIANEYKKKLACTKHQEVLTRGESCYHIFNIEYPNRDALISYLQKNGIQTLIHYPIPIHLQKCYGELNYKPGDFPVSEAHARQTISLPMFSELENHEVTSIVGLINQYVNENI